MDDTVIIDSENAINISLKTEMKQSEVHAKIP